MLIAVLITSLWLDHRYGELSSYHPLVGFGNMANWLEGHLNQGNQRLLKGLLALIVSTAPAILISVALSQSLADSWLLIWAFDSLILYWAIGHHSLKQHVNQVKLALISRDTEQARERLSYIVSRDTADLTTTQITQATIETTLENGSDGVFAPIFWYGVLGTPAVVAYRLINTLDAMWGYKNDRFIAFGKFSARADDVLNYLPARLVAITYALLGNAHLGFKCWQQQAKLLSSPNAGPVMSAGAGSLNVRLGGPTPYHGRLHDKPFFGGANQVQIKDIERSLSLIYGGLISWLAIIATAHLSL